MISLYLLHGWDKCVLHKLLSINTLKGDFSHNSKSSKTTSSKIKQLRIFIFRYFYSPFGRGDQFHGNHLFINRRQLCTGAMCTNLKHECKAFYFIWKITKWSSIKRPQTEKLNQAEDSDTHFNHFLHNTWHDKYLRITYQIWPMGKNVVGYILVPFFLGKSDIGYLGIWICI